MLNQRRFSELLSPSYDLLVVGGGIYGAGIAWDAALRGVSVCLVDKADFGGETSAACFKILHGGFRYLQHLDVRRIRESVAEQRTLRLIAPHLVKPLPILVPAYGWGQRGRFLLRAAAAVYDSLACDRNAGVLEELKLPRSTLLSRKQCLQQAPGLHESGLTGGLLFYDAQINSCERMTLSVVKAAIEAGARVSNYVEVLPVGKKEFLKPKPAYNLRVRDVLSGEQGDISARHVVLAAGSWNHFLLGKGWRKSQIAYSKGIQLTFRGLLSNYALAVESDHSDPGAVFSRGKRSYFLVPWRGMTLAGTTDTVSHEHPDDFDISEREILDMLGDLGKSYASDSLREDSLLHAWGGFRPIDPKIAANPDGVRPGDATAAREGRVESLFPGLTMITGVKYTTFRSNAERAVDLVVKALGGGFKSCITGETPLPGADYRNRESVLGHAETICEGSLKRGQLEELFSRYGSEIEDLLALAVPENKSWLGKISDSFETLEVEVRYACRKEMACLLEDIIMRRTCLGESGCPENFVVEQVAEIMGDEYQWSRGRKEEEVEKIISVNRFRHFKDITRDISCSSL